MSHVEYATYLLEKEKYYRDWAKKQGKTVATIMEAKADCYKDAYEKFMAIKVGKK